jgi:uncharacterized membrane protein
MINLSIAFGFLGLVLGVYYRELTKWTNFYDKIGAKTQLANTHVHVLVLGMVMMLVFGLLLRSFNKDTKDIKLGLRIYLGGFLLTLIMLITRGTIQVLSPNELKSSIDAMISGFAGIDHAILGTGLIMILFEFKKFSNENED